jgi:hypothetical protein
MPLPGSVTMVTVTADYRRADGTTPTGTVEFIPSARSLIAGTTITIEPVTVALVDGQLTAALAWQDDTDLTPHGWTYRVVENIGGDSRMWSVKLPQTGPVALDTLAPVDEVVPTIVRVLSVNGILPGSNGDVALPPSQGSAPSTRVIATTGGLQGGGDLSADRTLSPVYGATAGTVCEGSDSRLSDARTPLAHTHAQSDITGLASTLAAKASKLVVRDAYLTAGNLNLNSGTSSWGVLPSSPTLSIPAVAGDTIKFETHIGRQPNSNLLCDFGVVVAGVIKRWIGTGGTSAPIGSYEGDIAMYHTGGIPASSGARRFVVTNADLDTGNVVFAILCKVNGAGSALVLMDPVNPGYWLAENQGAVS